MPSGRVPWSCSWQTDLIVFSILGQQELGKRCRRPLWKQGLQDWILFMLLHRILNVY
ncbi:hypothetical protein M758_2G189900 [Ceratodon purpureus]|nr:hypothetical protein M758_2G189900 [Ceratodon purpureus]